MKDHLKLRESSRVVKEINLILRDIITRKPKPGSLNGFDYYPLLLVLSGNNKEFRFEEIKLLDADTLITPHDLKSSPTNRRSQDFNEKLLRKVTKICREHINDNDFCIEKLSRYIGISRGHLYRKIKAITGKSPSRFLRSIRLAAAREMIENRKGNISEISYSTGFSSPIYFSKCFRDEFGFPPSRLNGKK